MLACRLLDLTESNGRTVDRVIGLKFPAYLIKHPNKVLWILHQYRAAYELWGSPLADLTHYPDGLRVRNAIRQADAALIPESRRVYANSLNVARRLKQGTGLDAEPLYHPPRNAPLFSCLAAEDYVYFPSRIGSWKRQDLAIEAMSHVRSDVKMIFSGAPDNAAYLLRLQSRAESLGIAHRIVWLDHVSEERKRELYARCLGVVYPPVDEDLGYVTMEAMLSSKPVITCTDSGGTLEFVRHRESGLVCDATPTGLACAIDELCEHRDLAREWGQTGRRTYEEMDINWPSVVRKLLA
jgi:glycosyltransferase involved in cell wall biosynthesis